jgi:hypothetical protein
MIGIEPICLKCKHFQGELSPIGFGCAAFPDGIPAQIMSSLYDHREPYPNDNGILFAVIAGEKVRKFEGNPPLDMVLEAI